MKILWFDIETTGLNPADSNILEVGAVVTDEKFEELGVFNYIVYHPFLIADEWCRKTHTDSGLADACSKSNTSLTMIQLWLVDFIQRHFETTKPMLAGNSIHFDRSFIKYHMPHVEKLLHYRMIDVSALYEAFKIFKGKEFPKTKTPDHRVLSDIRGSINLCKEIMGCVG